MKVSIIILSATIFSSIIFTASYAQNGGDETDLFNVNLYAQFEYRDAHGQLVAYFVEDDPNIPDPKSLNDFLDSAPEQIVKKIGKFEIISLGSTIKFDRTTFSSQTTFSDFVDGKQINYAVANHDGYPVISGDTLTTTWTIIRSF